MRCAVRPMELADIPQVVQIEKEAFPTQWPPTPFERELLHNRLAAYLVAYEVEDEQETHEVSGTSPAPPEARGTLETFVSGVRRLLGQEERGAPARAQKLVGFVGLWFMVNEAHVTAIAVRESHRRHGIGELLLMAATELSMERNEEIMTLEVRVSNLGAQALYEKYGFVKVGVRPEYYVDNREDALIMSTPQIGTASFQQEFHRLREAHFQRYGANHKRRLEPNV